jgi:hypothetical protein
MNESLAYMKQANKVKYHKTKLAKQLIDIVKNINTTNPRKEKYLLMEV